MKIFATKQNLITCKWCNTSNSLVETTPYYADACGSFSTKRLDARLVESKLVCSVQNDFSNDFKKGDKIRVYSCDAIGRNEKTLFFVDII